MSDGPYSYVYNRIQAHSFKGDMGLEKFVQWSTITGFWFAPKECKEAKSCYKLALVSLH